MKQIARIISTYTADTMGVCSALFELGGMTVMHDASGCNSTYNTHDEPRWYDTDSLVFISGLSEIDAVTGNDGKLIDDIVKAAKDLHPAFIGIAGSPIPMMTGMDMPAVAKSVEQRTGITSFGFETNGMHSYLSGASMAFKALAERMLIRDVKPTAKGVNILGATPLDFSVNGSIESVKRLLIKNGFDIVSCWAMGSSLQEIMNAGSAQVNLVVSYAGLECARHLQQVFGMPYVVAMPTGEAFNRQIINALRLSMADGKNRIPYLERPIDPGAQIAVLGECVSAGSMATALTEKCGKAVKVICPLETEACLLAQGDSFESWESEIEEALKGIDILIADPLYKPIFSGEKFIPRPHEAFSGRIFRRDIVDMVDDLRIDI